MTAGLQDLGFDPDPDQVYRFVKVSVDHAADYYGTLYGVPHALIVEHYRMHSDDEGYESLMPYPGVEDFLRSVVAHGGDNFLYTHRGLSGIKAIEHFGIADCFRDAVTSADGFPSKPAPDALNFLCDKHKLDKNECVMLGDRLIDLGSGINAGMHAAILDPDGLCPAYDIPYRASSFAEMKKLLIDA